MVVPALRRPSRRRPRRHRLSDAPPGAEGVPSRRVVVRRYGLAVGVAPRPSRRAAHGDVVVIGDLSNVVDEWPGLCDMCPSTERVYADGHTATFHSATCPWRQP